MHVRISITRLMLIALCFSQADIALGDTYNTELSLNYSEADGPSSDNKRRGLSVNYHLSPVDDSKGPLAQAAFIARSSQVFFSYAQSETEPDLPDLSSFGRINIDPSFVNIFGNLPPGNGVPGNITQPTAFVIAAGAPFRSPPSTKTDLYSSRLSYVFDSDWLLGGGLESSRSDDDFLGLRSNVEGFGVNIHVGKYIRPLTTVTFEFSDMQIDTETHGSLYLCLFPQNCPPPVNFVNVTESTRQEWKIQAKHLQAGASVHHAFAGEVAYVYSDTKLQPGVASFDIPSLKTYGLITRLGYTVYPTSRIGLGVGFDYVDAEAGSASSLSFAADWFMTDYLSLRVNFSNNKSDLTGVKTDVIGAKLSGRF